MRRWLSFTWGQAELAGAIDEAEGTTGLLIVSGGNEIASGAHGAMASLAARVAAAGHPVIRFDRRGVGDSGGANGGFESEADDIAAALAALRAQAPHVERIVAFGNCDAATALGLFHAALAIDAIVLANPWTIEGVSETPPPAAIAARYREKLIKPSEWLRLLRGGVDLRKLVRGLRTIAETSRESGLAARLRDALLASRTPVTFVLAARDATCQAFTAHWRGGDWRQIRERAAVVEIDTASHSFADADDQDALLAALLEALT